ncbi:hypothetical protein QVD17_16287 [Tagetes erecta]|uniref:BHLH domain-containing protein n=1 Tax=Tagetes erecta TaxID=13708 RepID=A0AAD8KRV8_TARER|nr:hypothetical protein QVD17_16287 [Tagetes erecta]
MQPASDGLASFQSVPATWLDALLLSDHDDDDDIIGHNDSPKLTFNHVTTTDFVDPGFNLPAPDIGFIRQNSSPVGFVSHVNNSDLLVPMKYDYDDQVPSPVNGIKTRNAGLGESQMELTTRMLLKSLFYYNSTKTEKTIQDSAAFRVRAKRGFATHPRSIAERVRRTRISDRIRKLQELVPNMDKQTNTADMLEEAVEYVKFLQNQIQM